MRRKTAQIIQHGMTYEMACKDAVSTRRTTWLATGIHLLFNLMILWFTTNWVTPLCSVVAIGYLWHRVRMADAKVAEMLPPARMLLP